MRKIFLVLFVLVSTTFFAQHLEPLSENPQLRVGKLENGLSYYIQQTKGGVQRADFTLVKKVGTIFENENQQGFTDFLTYMAFRGTKNFPESAILNYFENVGMSFDRNITLQNSFEKLVYSISDVPTLRVGALDTALLVLHDWASSISLEGTKIDYARKHVLESRQIAESSSSRLENSLRQLKFPNSRYANSSSSCDSSLLLNFPAQALRDYYRAASAPEWQAVVVVGDVDPDIVEKKIRSLFKALPKHWGANDRIDDGVKNNKEPIVAILVSPEVPFSRLSIDYKQEKMNPELKSSVNGYLVSSINKLIVLMTNSRLAEIEQQDITPFVSASASYGALVKSKDAFSFAAVAQEGKELDCYEALLLEAEKIKRFGFLNSELELAKINLLKSAELLYNDSTQRSHAELTRACVDNFVDSEPVPGAEWEFEFLQTILPQLSVEMVNQIATAFISDKNLIISLSAAAKPGLVLPTENNFLESLHKSKAVKLEAPIEIAKKDLLLSDIAKPGKIKQKKQNQQLGLVEWVLSNGVRVVFKPTTFKNDEILMRAYSQGGLSLLDDVEDLPSAIFASELVSESGLGNLTKVELERALAGKRVELNPFIAEYSEGFYANSSVRDFEALLQLVNLHFVAPRLDESAFNLIRQKHRLDFLNREKNPDLIFADTLKSLLVDYSERVPQFNLALFDKVNKSRALEIYKERFSDPADFTFVFVGNINPADKKVEALISAYLGGLKSKKKREKYVDRGVRMPVGRTSKSLESEMLCPKASTALLFYSNMSYNLKNKVLMDAVQQLLTLRYNSLVREKELAGSKLSVTAGLSAVPLEQAVLRVSIESNARKQMRLSKIVESELYKLIAYGTSIDNLQKVKANLLKTHEENLHDNIWWADFLMQYCEAAVDLSTDYKTLVAELNEEQLKLVLKKLVMSGNKIELFMKQEN